MDSKQLNVGALIGSAAIFFAAFLSSAVNGPFYVSAVGVGGIWYLLPFAGAAGVVSAALALGGKLDMKVPSLLIGGAVFILGSLFAAHSKAALDQYVAMQADFSKGFDSSFFTGKPLDTSHISHSSFGLGFYVDLFGSLMLIGAGVLLSGKAKGQLADPVG